MQALPPIEAAKQLLSSKKKIAITAHSNPDGDAVGSSLALCIYLQKKGHHARVVLPNGAPSFFSWMPLYKEILFFDTQQEEATAELKQAEVIFTLDYNALGRVGKMGEVLVACQCDFVMIDHHYEPEDYAKLKFSDTEKSSTCQMVYDFIQALGDDAEIDLSIATCLYTGIMTDSGSFRFPRTTSTLHRVVADLLDKGVDNVYIHDSVYNSYTLNRLKLLARGLGSLVVVEDLKTAYITLTKQDLEALNFEKGDTEGFVNYALSIKGVIFAAIFTESIDEDCIKISFRSKGSFDVNRFSRVYFGGGGHKNASGARSCEDLKFTVSKFLVCLQNEHQNIKNSFSA